MPESVRWGPDNPHPLFGRKTELVWDGKYDEYGARRPVDIAGSAMPMQKIETVDMPREPGLWPGVAEEFHSRILVSSASFFG
jgi:adenine-specific DNA-methyltransferase